MARKRDNALLLPGEHESSTRKSVGFGLFAVVLVIAWVFSTFLFESSEVQASDQGKVNSYMEYQQGQKMLTAMERQARALEGIEKALRRTGRCSQ